MGLSPPLRRIHATLLPANPLACMLATDKKQRIIQKFQTHQGDTGSTQVQIAILSAEIDELAEHLKSHHKDNSSRRGLLRKVGERRRLLRYLKKENAAEYEKLVKKLKLKAAKNLAPDGQSFEEEAGENNDTEDESPIEQ